MQGIAIYLSYGLQCYMPISILFDDYAIPSIQDGACKGSPYFWDLFVRFGVTAVTCSYRLTSKNCKSQKQPFKKPQWINILINLFRCSGSSYSTTSSLHQSSRRSVHRNPWHNNSCDSLHRQSIRKLWSFRVAPDSRNNRSLPRLFCDDVRYIVKCNFDSTLPEIRVSPDREIFTGYSD